MTNAETMAIGEWTPEEAEGRLRELGALLHACVHDGASVGYILPFLEADAESFWRRKVLPGLRAGTIRMLVAEDGGAAIGTILLDLDTPPNQPHRAEVRKLMVHPRARRRGVARALLGRAERLALDLGRRLLTLDTRTGDAAEPLYASFGFAVVGMIPNYCLDATGQRLDSTTLMYKHL